ncbi:ArdC family protein, partial [Phaeocystidibacter marisrubri]
MSITAQFNNLHGRNITRKEVENLLDLSGKSKDPCAVDVTMRLKDLLKRYPDKKAFDLELYSPLTEGLYGLSAEGWEDDELGLGKPVSPEDVYQKVTEMVIEAIEKKGNLPWRKSWKSVNKYGISASNFASKKAYRGINAMLLNFIIPALTGRNWDIPYFLTFKQIQERGGKLKKGSKGYMVVYFMFYHKYQGKTITENEYWKRFSACGEKGSTQDQCETLERIPMLKYYKVFNADDIEGIDWKLKKVAPKKNSEKIEIAEAIVTSYPTAPELVLGGDDAYYSPGDDYIQLPYIEAFDSPQEFYSTFFHEMVHSTGHSTRLSRELNGNMKSKAYAFEELIAEMGANYLNAEAGILYFTLDNSAPYLQNWMGRLKSEMEKDNKFFFRACSAAQEAADYILARDSKGVPAYMSNLNPEVAQVLSKNDQLELALAGPVDNIVNSAKKLIGGAKQIKELSGELKDLFVTADKKDAVKRPDTFRLPGKIGEFMQDLQRYKLAILLKGDPHAGKSEFVKQLIDGFLDLNWSCAFFDLEQGGLASKDTIQSIERNVKPKNRSRLFVAAEAPSGFDTVKKAAE